MFFVTAGEIIVEMESLSEHGHVSEPLLLSDILAFFTGADRIPPEGFSTKPPCDPKLKFLHDDDEPLATASTCDLILRLPVKYHNDPEKFEEMMILSFKGYKGFGRP